MTLQTGCSVRIRTDLEPDFLQALARTKKLGTQVEVRSALGERILASEAWVSFIESSGGRLEIVLNLGTKPKSPQEANLSKHDREERNRKILELYAEGKTQDQIKELLGCSRDTVQTVIRKSAFGEQHRGNLEAEVMRRHAAGQSQETIRRALSMSRSWVGNVIRAAGNGA